MVVWKTVSIIFSTCVNHRLKRLLNVLPVTAPLTLYKEFSDFWIEIWILTEVSGYFVSSQKKQLSHVEFIKTCSLNAYQAFDKLRLTT
jgi:hypothetical protein